MDYNRLAELLFPHINTTPEEMQPWESARQGEPPAARSRPYPPRRAVGLERRSRQDGRHQEHTLFGEPERPQPFPQPFEPKACFSHNKIPFFVPDLYKKMVNKKCERDVWSSGKNGENNAEKPRPKGGAA